MLDESGQSSGFGVVALETDTITAIKKALDVDMNQGVTAVDRLRLLAGGQPDFAPLTEEDAEWIENALKSTIAALESLQRKNEKLRTALKPFSQIAEVEDRLKTRSGESVLVNVDICRRARTTLSSTGDTHGN